MSTTTDVERDFLITILNISPGDAAKMTIADLRLEYFKNPPSGGGGAVDSVNGKTDAVVLNYTDVGAQKNIPIYANEAAVLTALGNGEVAVGDIVGIESP